MTRCPAPKSVFKTCWLWLVLWPNRETRKYTNPAAVVEHHSPIIELCVNSCDLSWKVWEGEQEGEKAPTHPSNASSNILLEQVLHILLAITQNMESELQGLLALFQAAMHQTDNDLRRKALDRLDELRSTPNFSRLLLVSHFFFCALWHD